MELDLANILTYAKPSIPERWTPVYGLCVFLSVASLFFSVLVAVGILATDGWGRVGFFYFGMIGLPVQALLAVLISALYGYFGRASLRTKVWLSVFAWGGVIVTVLDIVATMFLSSTGGC